MICDRCKKDFNETDIYNCGGCGAVICEDCLALSIEEAELSGHSVEYCSVCWK
jgi:hypothetical protein